MRKFRDKIVPISDELLVTIGLDMIDRGWTYSAAGRLLYDLFVNRNLSENTTKWVGTPNEAGVHPTRKQRRQSGLSKKEAT